VVLGPDLRRGVSDLDGTGEVVSGIVVMRQGKRPGCHRTSQGQDQGDRTGLPPGVKVVPVYDRSDLILQAIDTLKSTLVEIIITVALVILLFLWHIPSALIPMITIPVAVLVSFIPFKMMGSPPTSCRSAASPSPSAPWWTAAIVVVEQTHKKLEEWNARSSGGLPHVVIDAVKQVAGPSFFSLL